MSPIARHGQRGCPPWPAITPHMIAWQMFIASVVPAIVSASSWGATNATPLA
jgi:hypothetical protein